MSGYAAQARIVRAAPRLARADARAADPFRDEPRSLRGSCESPAPALMADLEANAPDGPRGMSGGERWAAMRERWSQLTFFLLDANSWR